MHGQQNVKLLDRGMDSVALKIVVTEIKTELLFRLPC